MTGAALDRRKLGMLLGMLGSDFDGEVTAAGRAADKLVREAGLQWPDVLVLAPAPEAPAARPVRSTGEKISRCLAADCLTDWERQFLHSLRRRCGPPTPRQLGAVDGIDAKVTRAEGWPSTRRHAAG